MLRFNQVAFVGLASLPTARFAKSMYRHWHWMPCSRVESCRFLSFSFARQGFPAPFSRGRWACTANREPSALDQLIFRLPSGKSPKHQAMQSWKQSPPKSPIQGTECYRDSGARPLAKQTAIALCSLWQLHCGAWTKQSLGAILVLLFVWRLRCTHLFEQRTTHSQISHNSAPSLPELPWAIRARMCRTHLGKIVKECHKCEPFSNAGGWQTKNAFNHILDVRQI